VFRKKSDDNPSIVFDAVIAIDDPDPELMRPGMAATVELAVDRLRDVIVVPEEAVVYTPQGPVITLCRTVGDTTSVAVILGRSAAGRVAVLDGLEEGDVVLVPERGGRGS
jgi:HlyD family secretion protein